MNSLIAFGGVVKALGNGKFKTPLVTFSGPNDPDLMGDFFTSETDYWTLKDGRGEVTLLYDHGLDPKMKRRRLGEGKASLEMDDVAIWMSGQVDMADEYQSAIYEMIEAGKLGSSSGAVAHLVDRESKSGAYWIKSWPLFEGSLTPTPAEPRNRVVPIKSVYHSLNNAGALPTERQLEEILRDAGFTRRESGIIISHGYKAALRDAGSTGSDTPPADTPANDYESLYAAAELTLAESGLALVGFGS